MHDSVQYLFCSEIKAYKEYPKINTIQNWTLSGFCGNA